jgi:nucleotide-binding universal stress UspA family protein
VAELSALTGTPEDGQPIAAKPSVAKASPELLYRLAQDESVAPELRLAAAERAASLNVIGGEELARAYREAVPALPKTANSPPALRAKLFASFESAPSAKMRAESISALLASARDQGIEVPTAQALARASAGLMDDPQAATFAETGIRIAALAGDEQSAWAWVDAGGDRLRSWQLLLAASDPFSPRAEAALDEGVDLAVKGGLPAPLLHRLVTVLDALDYNVPMSLWDATSKTPQPNDGDLPETGALTELKQAADSGEVGRTVLMVAAVLGPKGAQGAHLIALGDALRALKRVGLDAEARRLGFEALYAHWPTRGKA